MNTITSFLSTSLLPSNDEDVVCVHPERRALLPKETSSTCGSSSDESASIATACTLEESSDRFLPSYSPTPSPYQSSAVIKDLGDTCLPQGTSIPTVNNNNTKVITDDEVEEETLVQANKSTRTSTTLRVAKVIKYCASLTLLGFCLDLISSGIMADGTPIAKSAHPIVALVTMWLLLIWLGILEGGQGCLVGLQPIDKNRFKHSHPTTYQCVNMVPCRDTLNRFIVGRQFLVVLVVFFLNLCCTVVEDAIVPGFAESVVELVLASGLAVMLITVIVGQLSAEVNATNCMLDFINNPSVVATTWICLAIENSGLLHSVYLIQCFFSSSSTTDTKTSASASTYTSPKRTLNESILYWSRVAFSSTLLFGAMVVTMSALLNDETSMCGGMPTLLKISIFVGLVCFLGILEAMQIAVFAVVNLPEEALATSPAAKATCDMVYSGQNFKAFLIGRQICVTTSMFLLARITTTDVDTSVPGTDTNVFGVSDQLQDFFNTGLPGALITTIVASLVWRIAASSYPIAFMANPIVNLTIRLCLMLEATGVFSASWLLADSIKALLRFQTDDVYLSKVKEGTTDEEQGLSMRYHADDPASPQKLLVNQEDITENESEEDYEEAPVTF